MERASRALIQTRYFECEAVSRRALWRAYARRDYDRMGRILMPLQECQRLQRQLARDAAACFAVRRPPRTIRPGYHLVAPPLVGLDARMLRERADESRVPALILAREPATESGLWPIVAVGSPRLRLWPVVIRTRVEPPLGPSSLPRPEWFELTSEALGDAGLVTIDHNGHPAWRVDDLMLLLDAHPDHEKIHQRLEEACRDARRARPPAGLRPRNDGDPACFI